MERDELKALSELADAHGILRSVLDTVPNRIFWKGLDLRYLGCNAAFARDAGLADALDVQGKDDSQMPWSEQAAQYHADDQGVLDSCAPLWGVEELQTTCDGRTVWLRTSKMPLRDENGSVVGVLGVYDDISELVHARSFTALRTHLLEIIMQPKRDLGDLLKEMILAIEAAQPDLIGSVLLMDSDGLHLRHGAGPNLPQAYIDAIDGVAIGPAVGSCGTAAYHGKEVFVSDIASDPLWHDYKDLALASGLAACFSEPVLNARGAVLGTFAMYWPNPRTPTDDDLLAIRMLGNLAAIAIERHADQRALQTTEQVLEALADHSSTVIYVKDVDGKYLLINSAFERLFNTSKFRVIGKTDYDIFPVENAEIYRQNDHLALSQHSPIQVEESALTRNGERIYLSVKFALRDSHGHAYATANISTDITERKASEQALQHHQEVLERTVLERTAELTGRIEQMRRFTLLAADRELRIQELRRENVQLRQQLAMQAGMPQ